MNVGIIILSAGNSSRLGSPKQLLAYLDTTLLEHTLDAAAASGYAPIVLVLGANADQILQSIGTEVNYVINKNWEQGISTSIATGLKKMLELAPAISDVIIAVSDQPHISPAIFKALGNQSQQTRKNIVASSYAQTSGTPVLFNKKYFHELLLLTGDTGAKPILQKYAADVATVAFDLGYIDIDTQTDYNNLTQAQ